uniref:Uncharacterized protein n=1 Tax=viral metagenome TaxID=1070528 RepID=A0A6C0KBM3_9ZZZZ
MEYKPLPGNLTLIHESGKYILVTTQHISENVNLGITNVFVSNNLPNIRTPLGAFLTHGRESEKYDYNCCIRSTDLRTFYLWTTRALEKGEIMSARTHNILL